MQADAKSRQFINAVAWAVWKRFFSWRPKRGGSGTRYGSCYKHADGLRRCRVSASAFHEPKRTDRDFVRTKKGFKDRKSYKQKKKHSPASPYVSNGIRRP